MKAFSAILVLLFFTLTACETRVVSDSWDRYRALADKSRATPATQSPYGPASFTEGWAILLETFDGSKQDTRAAQLVKRLRHDLSLPDVWIRQIDNKTSVMRGHYFDASDEAARSDLRQTRMLVLDGTRPYESVELVPLSESARGGTGSMDLRQFAGKGLYTLQVAAFDEAYGKDFRKAAERYAAELRAKGDQAFFYHGNFLSLVTVGIFNDADFTEVEVVQPTSRGLSKFKQRVYGPRIEYLQKTYPVNLFNGYTVVETSPDGSKREQPSFMVPAGAP